MIPIRKAQPKTAFYEAGSEFPPRTIGKYTIKTDKLLLREHLFLDGKELFCADKLEVDTRKGTAVGICIFCGCDVFDLATEQLAFSTDTIEQARAICNPRPPYHIF